MKIFFALIAVFSLSASAAELTCEAQKNYQLAWSQKISIADGQKIQIGSVDDFTAYIKSEGQSLYEIEIFDGDTPSRQYAEGQIQAGQRPLKWALWNREVILEVSCRQ